MTYIVKPGDSINSISEKFNVNIIDLIKENHLENIFYLTPGLELIIPIPGNGNSTDLEQKDDAFSYYTIKKGDTLYQIGRMFNISPQLLAEINGLELNEYIFPDQKILVPNKGVNVYITKDGDTLNLVASDLDISKEDIILYNKNLYLLPDQLIAYKILKNNNN